MYELEAVIDDEFYTIMYKHDKVDNYLGEWLNYATVTDVRDSKGNIMNIMDDYTFFSKCEKVANEVLTEYLEDYYNEE